MRTLSQVRSKAEKTGENSLVFSFKPCISILILGSNFGQSSFASFIPSVRALIDFLLIIMSSSPFQVRFEPSLESISLLDWYVPSLV